jgi:biopolymer transport protein ExbD
MAKWDILHVKSLEVEQGLAEDLIRTQLAEGRISRDDCVRKSGDDQWWHIYERTEFRGMGEAVEIVEEPPRLEEGSLRNVLAEAEPAYDARSRRRPVAAPVARRADNRPAEPAPPARPGGGGEDAGGGGGDFLPPKKVPAEQEDIDMAPACTVSFLLILFFVIVSGVAIQMAISFPKPSPDDRQQAAPVIPKTLEDLKKDNIVVEIKADNSIWIDEDQVKPQELVNRVTTLKRDRGAMNLIIKADDASHHQTVVSVVDAGYLAGMQNIKMAAVKATKKAARKRAVKS